MRNRTACVMLAAMAMLPGCASKPAAEVSRDELVALRAAHAATRPGAPKEDVLRAYEAGNKVKLGAAEIDGASIEEWKVEAFHDQDKRKDIFVSFLYFCDGRLVDSSDTRIDFRNNSELVDRWRGASKR